MLRDTFQAEARQALRQGDAARRRIFQGALARFLEVEKEAGFAGWTEQLEVEVLAAYVKKLEKARSMMREGDLADQYAREIEVLSDYLPKKLDEAATRALAEPYAARAKGRLGPFMGMVLAAHKDKVDPAILRKVAADLGLS